MDTLKSKSEFANWEAFKLMWYKCSKCGHCECIWNSRDGVTPFSLRCPSCGKPHLTHISWSSDVYAPNHELHKGQRFFRDGTPDEAEAIMRKRIERNQDKHPLESEEVEHLVQISRDGSSGEFPKGWPMLDMEPLR